MKIAHLSRSDMGGGAALAAYRLHTALRGVGEDSAMLVEDSMAHDATVRVALLNENLGARVRRNWRVRRIEHDRARYLQNRPQLATLFSDDRAPYGYELAEQIDPEAVVTLHWIARFVQLGELLRALGPHRRYVWWLADMNPFTGGCHADGGCGRFVAECGECPMLASAGPRDLSHQVWARKKAALERLGDGQLEVVAVSSASASQARSSSLLGRFHVTVIPPAVDTTVFRPFDRSFSREVLGLEVASKVLLYTAYNLVDPLKGADMLSEAMMGLGRHDVTLVTMGYGSLPGLDSSVQHVALGSIVDAHQAALVYNCADLVVLPSRQESFGQVVIEALACGVPVAGFDTHGMRDAIVDGVNGFLVHEPTADGLRDTLLEALADVSRLNGMREACLKSATPYSASSVARDFQGIYRSLIAGNSGGKR